MSADSDMDYSSDCEFEDYYNNDADFGDIEQIDPKNPDQENLIYECLSIEEVEKLLNENVHLLSTVLKITPSLAKVLLSEQKWNVQGIVEKYRENANEIFISARIKPSNESVATKSFNHKEHNQVVISSSSSTSSSSSLSSSSSSSIANDSLSGHRLLICNVCIIGQCYEKFYKLSCGHLYCKDCWTMHFETQINLGISIRIGCMTPNCDVRVPEDLLLTLLNRPAMRDKYQQFAFQDYVKSHPELRFCPGPNCQIIVRSKDISPKRTICKSCNTTFCFKCGTDYHAPTDCSVIKRWLTKCIDDSETANYINAHTKDCPHCQICIEKNGGCNHMQCSKCKHDFCWMCLGDWKNHGSDYYECSRYKENPNIAHESIHVQAREALRKYLHYYERWANHSKSLQLEQQTMTRMKARINDKVMKGLGTWIDWQHLFNAATLLAKCRYTLQYTYPYAYFMESGSQKNLFEYQQAQLEAEIENLSWKIERFETIHRGDLENQMDISEKRRTTLLKDFFPVSV